MWNLFLHLETLHSCKESCLTFSLKRHQSLFASLFKQTFKSSSSDMLMDVILIELLNRVCIGGVLLFSRSFPSSLVFLYLFQANRIFQYFAPLFCELFSHVLLCLLLRQLNGIQPSVQLLIFIVYNFFLHCNMPKCHLWIRSIWLNSLWCCNVWHVFLNVKS